jgi:hypothetical protein
MVILLKNFDFHFSVTHCEVAVLANENPCWCHSEIPLCKNCSHQIMIHYEIILFCHYEIIMFFHYEIMFFRYEILFFHYEITRFFWGCLPLFVLLFGFVGHSWLRHAFFAFANTCLLQIVFFPNFKVILTNPVNLLRWSIILKRSYLNLIFHFTAHSARSGCNNCSSSSKSNNENSEPFESELSEYNE